ncbi:hypothetical protein BGT96224_Ac30739 [Blumeria graminis f. sp. tritici 96224]|nr:hypothetical protein BGT96224_Ac30739 [Blumeria graminis f. sp. tritici 96224]
MASEPTAVTTDCQGFTLITIKKADEPKRGLGCPQGEAIASVAPTTAATEVRTMGPTLRRLQRSELDEEVPSFFNIS